MYQLNDILVIFLLTKKTRNVIFELEFYFSFTLYLSVLSDSFGKHCSSELK
jgi:hypothetical protein